MGTYHTKPKTVFLAFFARHKAFPSDAVAWVFRPARQQTTAKGTSFSFNSPYQGNTVHVKGVS